MRSSVSIALFFLLSGFFLSTLLGALEHSRRLLGAAATCFVAVACVIAFLTPIQLPSWGFISGRSSTTSSTTTTSTTPAGPVVGTTISTLGVMVDTTFISTEGTMAGPQVTTEAPGVPSR